ncbi:MAG: hypothetical protein CEE38_17665 [Planctomycetes bacterium B3_Pla]|nr:MAG: hypothetical protein CEE38_17665 [Planctomycetes bacterium B3_Pla]
MLGRKTILGVAAVLVIGLLLASQSLSQPEQRGQRGGPGGRQFDPARMRQMMEQRMREQLGATEQEWKVLGSRVTKVAELGRQTSGFGRGGMMFGMGGRRGGPGGPGGNRFGGGRPGAPDREPTAVEKAQEQLRTVLEDTSATPDQIKTQLTALRKARETAKQQLAAAQQKLREIITVRQEATLVMMGMLD